MREAVTRTAPTTSAPLPSPMPRSDRSSRHERSAAAMPMGTLTKKIQCQLMACVRIPPARSPIEAPAPSRQQEQPAERDEVRVHHPRKARLRKPEVALDRWKRHVDDGAVEDDHQDPGAEHVESRPAPFARACESRRLGGFHNL